MIVEAALLCMALNAYHEARGEPLEGQIAVNQVAMRRAGYAPENVCREIYRPRQFSWTHQVPSRKRPPVNAAWRRAQYAARVTLLWAHNPALPDYSNGATHYHASHIKPYWIVGKVRVAVIGRHIFYRRK